MSGNDSEEKRLPPTPRKLRRAREKEGKVASSRDFTSALVTAVAIATLIVTFPRLMQALSGLFDIAIASMTIPWPLSWRRMATASSDTLLLTLASFLILAVGAVVIGNILHKKGIPLSGHPVKPDFNRLNPVEGLKRIFGVRGWVEFGVILVRQLLWLPAAGFLIWLFLPSTFTAPLCGLACTLRVAIVLCLVLAALALLFLILFGLLDLPVQFALFRRDMRMSHSELKREQKEEHGSPEVRAERKRLRDVLLGRRSEKKKRQKKRQSMEPTLTIAGAGVAVAIRFVRGETPAPIVVASGRGAAAERIVESARRKGRSLHEDEDLAETLHKQGTPGQQVPASLYHVVALAMLRSGPKKP